MTCFHENIDKLTKKNFGYFSLTLKALSTSKSSFLDKKFDRGVSPRLGASKQITFAELFKDFLNRKRLLVKNKAKMCLTMHTKWIWTSFSANFDCQKRKKNRNC